ncbi:MAG: hypothetical protein WAT51_13490 [Holophaga sp.]
MKRTILAILLVLPLAAQADAKKHKGTMQDVQSNPLYTDKGAKSVNPLYQDKGNQGVNPHFEDTRRQVQDILNGLKPPVAAKLQAAAEELDRTPILNGPEAPAWQTAEAATRRALGAGMPADAEGATAVVICLWASKKGYDYYKASTALARASNVLKTKHDTVKNSINNVR